MIEFLNVQLNINKKTVVKNFSVNIKENSKAVFLGEKKSGKTLFFKLLTGCYYPTKGSITIDGINIRNYNVNENISLIYDKRELKMNLTVNEYLKFYGEIKRINDIDLNVKIDYYLKKYGLISLKYDNIDNLSIFEYKVLCFIKSILNNPNIILFDEYFKNLTLIEVNNLKKLIFSEDLTDKTIIFTSNKLDNFLDICDFTGIIVNQQIIDYNTIEKILKITENGRRIELIVRDNNDLVKSLLVSKPYITNIVSIDNKYIFTIKNDRISESDVLEFLINNGIKVISFNKLNYNFEEIISEIQFKKELK